MNHQPPTELEILLEGLCEERLTADELRQLERLVLASPEARWQYLTYIDLHGTLYWDAAGAGSPEPLSSQEIPAYVPPDEPVSLPASESKNPNRRWMPLMLGTLAASIVFGISFSRQPNAHRNSIVTVIPAEPASKTQGDSGTETIGTPVVRTHGPPVQIEIAAGTNSEEPQTLSIVDSKPPKNPLSSNTVIARIDEEIQSRWADLAIQASDKADDSEWMRRVYLDLLGRVPSVREAEQFLADQRQKKREILVEDLLADTGFVRNLTTKWANLLIGRATGPQVNRDAFEKFLRLSFSSNRPWNQIVSDLISAEGSNAENGATNFLIAHLNNDATPATAVCSKLFLGRQVHCNQCHNNPFDESKQIAFWELNSFFQQTTSVYRQRRDPTTGRSL